jgi:hypothetical protein
MRKLSVGSTRIKLFIALWVLNCSGLVYASNYETIIESGTAQTLLQIKYSATKSAIAKSSMGNIMQWVALQLLGKPYSIALLDRKTPEYLYISLANTDCMLFIEEVVALSELIKNNDLNMHNFTREIYKLRYHGSLAYCNRNHYFKDWAISNQTLFIDEAKILTGITYPYKAHVISDNLAKSESNPHFVDLACIKARENLINQEDLGFIPLAILPKYLSRIQSGDIVGIVRESKGRPDDIYHLGIAYVNDGHIGMVNASSIAKKVIITDDLIVYLKQFNNSKGIILLRARD